MTDHGPRIIAKVSRFQKSFGKYPEIPRVINVFLKSDDLEKKTLPDYRKAVHEISLLESNNHAIKKAILLDFVHHLHIVQLFLRSARYAMMEKQALLAMAEDFLTLEFVEYL
jgi:hypothetical protein